MEPGESIKDKLSLANLTSVLYYCICIMSSLIDGTEKPCIKTLISPGERNQELNNSLGAFFDNTAVCILMLK